MMTMEELAEALNKVLEPMEKLAKALSEAFERSLRTNVCF